MTFRFKRSNPIHGLVTGLLKAASPLPPRRELLARRTDESLHQPGDLINDVARQLADLPVLPRPRSWPLASLDLSIDRHRGRADAGLRRRESSEQKPGRWTIGR